MRRRLRHMVLPALILAFASSTPQHAATAAGYCPGAGRRVAQTAPASLLPTVAQIFGVSPQTLAGGAYVRCVGSRLMACWVGANLDCGKADRRRALPGATAYCRDNPGSPDIPMAATGHATIYDWRCVGRRALAGRVVTPVDAQGYIAANWRAAR